MHTRRPKGVGSMLGGEVSATICQLASSEYVGTGRSLMMPFWASSWCPTINMTCCKRQLYRRYVGMSVSMPLTGCLVNRDALMPAQLARYNSEACHDKPRATLTTRYASAKIPPVAVTPRSSAVAPSHLPHGSRLDLLWAGGCPVVWRPFPFGWMLFERSSHAAMPSGIDRNKAIAARGAGSSSTQSMSLYATAKQNCGKLMPSCGVGSWLSSAQQTESRALSLARHRATMGRGTISVTADASFSEVSAWAR